VTKNVVLVNMTPPTVLVALVSELTNQLVIAQFHMKKMLLVTVLDVIILVLLVLITTLLSMVVPLVQKPLTESEILKLILPMVKTISLVFVLMDSMTIMKLSVNHVLHNVKLVQELLITVLTVNGQEKTPQFVVVHPTDSLLSLKEN
jgi:hypothetical protein